MGISGSISRFTDYYLRRGFGATIRRAGLEAKRALFSNRMVVFYCDLATHTALPVNIPNSMRVDRLRSETELSQQDLQDITSFWNPKQARRNIKERFAKGASLWLITSGDKLAGYGWTLQGGTIEPHYFPLGLDDVHLFDFHVFPQYRGQGMNPLLVIHILRSLAREGGRRAFIEAAEWNEAQLSSLRKTPFQLMGWARKSTIFHRTIVCWARTKPYSRDTNIQHSGTERGRMSNEAAESLRPLDHLKLHHIGFVVSSIQQSAESFERSLRATWDGNIVLDPVQNVYVAFLQGLNPTDPSIELVEPGGPESPVSQFLKRGGGLHHLCYEVKDLESHLAFCRSVGTIIIRPPVPAVAFGGRRIAWAVTKKKLLVEFLEC